MTESQKVIFDSLPADTQEMVRKVYRGKMFRDLLVIIGGSTNEGLSGFSDLIMQRVRDIDAWDCVSEFRYSEAQIDDGIPTGGGA
jgi:hypothetical protein